MIKRREFGNWEFRVLKEFRKRFLIEKKDLIELIDDVPDSASFGHVGEEVVDGGTVVTPAAVVAMGAYGNSVCLAISFHGISWNFMVFIWFNGKQKKKEKNT